MNNTVHQFLDGERLDALTQIYLDLSLPLKVALWAAAADLRDLDMEKTDSRWRCFRGRSSEMEALLPGVIRLGAP
jgi:hypothetical protein